MDTVYFGVTEHAPMCPAQISAFLFGFKEGRCFASFERNLLVPGEGFDEGKVEEEVQVSNEFELQSHPASDIERCARRPRITMLASFASAHGIAWYRRGPEPMGLGDSAVSDWSWTQLTDSLISTFQLFSSRYNPFLI